MRDRYGSIWIFPKGNVQFRWLLDFYRRFAFFNGDRRVLRVAWRKQFNVRQSNWQKNNRHLSHRHVFNSKVLLNWQLYFLTDDLSFFSCSSISASALLGIPTDVYLTGSMYWWIIVAAGLSIPVSVYVYLPFYHQLQLDGSIHQV